MELLQWVDTNKGWLFSGGGVALIIFLVNLYKNSKQEDEKKNNTPTVRNTNNGGSQNSNTGHSNTQIIQNFGSPPTLLESENKVNMQKPTTSELKSKIRVLFIDDNDFPIVKNLKKAGWNTDLINDVYDIDDTAILASHILFVDINGVAKSLSQEEGLGLVKALKRKYGDTKKVIIYSSDEEGNRFNEAFKLADTSLPKQSDYFEFLALVEKYAEEVFNN